MKHQVLAVLSSLLGEYTQKTGENYAFYCPFCKHHKKKLEVQIETQHWNCWVCESKGRSLYTLFKKAKATDEQFKRLNNIGLNTNIKVVSKRENVDISLPNEFIPLWENNSSNFFYRTCVKYLLERGVRISDFYKYKLGYCDSGAYKNMIIFPNYDSDGELNYFTTRTFIKNNSIKFKNPPYSKNVVGFEFQLNWDMPIIIVESALDAIIVRNNATPLYGKMMSEDLKYKLLYNNVKTVYIALDSDAMEHAYRHASTLIGYGLDVAVLQLPNGCDPNSLGYDRFNDIIKKSTFVSEFDLFTKKVEIML